jgi:hypothetical protein
MSDLHRDNTYSLFKKFQQDPTIFDMIDILFVPVGNKFEGIKKSFPKCIIDRFELFGNSIDELRSRWN